MSAICGILYPTEVAELEETLRRMIQALAQCGLDGTQIWQQKQVGLGCQMLYATPESMHESLPWQHLAAKLTITADARLDNRAELMQALNVPHFERNHCTDSQLILWSYEKWGEQCPQYLLGDFAFAIWDERRSRLFCCRDHLGRRPFFYFHDGRCFLFASEAKGILAAPAVEKRLNRQKLAALALPGGRQHLHEITFFEKVFSLPAATSLIVDRRGLRKQTYWQPDISARLPFKRDEEALEAFRALLCEVVGARLRSAFPVTALLSGGLDSSAIVSVAARILAQQGQMLTTFSAVLPAGSNPKLCDEREYIDQFRNWPNLNMHYITAPGGGPFDNVEEQVWDYESPMLTSRHYLYTAFAATARAAGARVLLDGVGGELGPTFHGDGYYAELLLSLRWLTLWREFRARRQVDNLNHAAFCRSHLLSYLVPPALLKQRQRATGQRIEGQVLQAAFMRQQFAGAEHEWQTPLHRKWPDHRKNQRREMLAVFQKHARLIGRIPFEALEIRLPFWDKRLLEFCLAAPGRLKVQHGYNRYLIRAGLDGILPPGIQWRTSKAPFSPDYYERYAAQSSWVAAYLFAIPTNDPVREIVDVEQLKLSFASTIKQSGSSGLAAQAASHLVPFGVYLIAFLRQFAEFKTAHALSLSDLRSTVRQPATLA